MFKDPDPVNPYGRGSGQARSLGDELEIDEYAAKHSKNFFYNRARPDIIVSGDTISRDDADRLKTQWLNEHQGFWNSFKPIFFSRKVDIKEMTQSMESTQMTQLRRMERDAVIQVYGIPPEKLGVVGESKRSTIAAADLFWTKDVVQPRVELMRATMQKWLAPQFDERLILDYLTPVIRDEEFNLEVMKSAAWSYTVNDWRKAAQKESIGPAGDVFVVPLNQGLARIVDGELVMDEVVEPEPTEPANDDEEEVEVEDDEEDNLAEAASIDIPFSKEAPPVADTEVQVTAMIDAVTETIEKLRPQIDEAVKLVVSKEAE
jgi:hypothetical protein